MIYNYDDYEQFLKESEKIEQTVQERQNALSQEDQIVFSKLKHLNYSEIKEPEDFIPKQILNKYSQHPIVNQQQRNQNNIQKEEDQVEKIYKNDELIKNAELLNNDESISSDTQSLSIINDKYEQFTLIDQQQWQKVLNQYGRFFQDYKDGLIIKTNRQLNYFFNFNKNVQQDQGNNNKLYLGLLIQTKEWIVVKEQQLYNQSLIEASQQFVIHDFIYQLYPTKFLKLWQPVFIQIVQSEKLKFISVSEQGLIDLYQYSQQKLIKDLELQLIFQQILQQIQLLHKHNIAHRDIKPQNIIYVENKGWVLCDFENSLKYMQMNGFYDIKGTFAFLMPQIQIKSRIQGLQMNQNLLQNDLYALAITLIVIKYQIKSQELIEQHLKLPQDPIIQVLLKSVSLEYLHKYNFKYEIRFIRPQLKQATQQGQNYQHQELIEFQITLGKLKQTSQITNEYKIELLNQIDELLKKKERHDNYYHIICYWEIPQYVDQLKYIVKYKELRQRKYWKNVLYKLGLINNVPQILNQIKFMYSIGLTDLFLQYAQQYIQKKYDFSIHIKIIDLLNLFQYYEEAENQLNVLLQYREFYQMNQYEQELFAKYSATKCFKYMNNQEIEYIKLLGLKIQYTNNMKFLIDNSSDEQFYEQVVPYIEKIIKQEKILITSSILNIYRLIVDVFIVKDIKISLKLLEIIKQKQRFSCTTFNWSTMIKDQIQLNELLEINSNKLIKKLNYVTLYNSENRFQLDAQKFKKYSIQLYCNSKNKQFQQKINLKIQLLLKNLQKCPLQFYSFATMSELILVLVDAFQKNILNQYFHIITYICKSQYLRFLTPENQDRFLKLVIKCYENTKNNKRLQNSVPKDILVIIANHRNLDQLNQMEIKNKQFFLNYICL